MRHVVIVGGGVIGSSVAYHLASMPDFVGSIVVIERDPTYTRASSALSASSIRVQFSTPINVALSRFGLDFIANAATLLAVGDDRPVLGLRQPGYLTTVAPVCLAALHDNYAVQKAAGADVALLEPEAMATRFPWLSTDGLAAGVLGLSGEGWFNGPALHMALRAKARSLGVTFLAREAVGIDPAGVRLNDRSVVQADDIVNAAGGWAAEVAAWCGIDLPIRPRRRMVFTFNCRDDLPAFPLLVDPSGVWVRPEGSGYICGYSPDEGEDDPDEPPLEIDEAVFQERLWPILAARVPAFEALRLTGGWAGYYDMNLFDHNGVVGAVDAAPRMIHAAGFSGHGMQHASGVGRGVAEMLVHGRFVSLDLSPLATSRIGRGEKLLENCVI